MPDNDWKKVEIDNSWNYLDQGEGTEFVGIYLAKQEHVGENDSIIYNFERDGEMISVWGSTVLDIRMKNIKIGEEVKIVYKGKAESQKRKGKTYHDFDVYHRMPAMKKVENVESKDIPF